jgi:hypothetical protein
LPALPLVVMTTFADPADAAGKAHLKRHSYKDVTVTWVPPTQRQDGTPLGMTEIAAYRVLYGPDSGKYNKTITIRDAYDTDAVLRHIPRGRTVYVAVEAVDRRGLASGPSEELTVRVD